ncbi:uncharacterized protein TNIN_120421 [Trichonephila inaurata madagascariensis]|uniref:Uncharacterized protein n=1 Tax=Trichonephila inaurata madagascariensis TaxID=2747483 RepID=A0A8X6Y1C4_9ARAC|nr:uncharacterized protein TNIN_120421 [Trichonephila inaurata madagascariensis]
MGATTSERSNFQCTPSMSDSKDKPTQRRRGRSAKSPEEQESSNTPMDTDPSDKPVDPASKDQLEKDSAAQASTSFGGARPKVRSRKKSKKESDKCDSITGTIERAVNILESTSCRRREEFRERKRLKKMEQNVTRYLGPGWVDTLIQDEPRIPAEGSITDSLRKLARSILISEFDRRRSERKEDLKPWIPVAYRLAKPRIPCPLSDEPVECDFDDDFEIELDTDPDLPLQIKLPGLSKKDPESPEEPKEDDDEPHPDAPSGAEHEPSGEGHGPSGGGDGASGAEQAGGQLAARYRGRNIHRFLFLPYNRFAPREQEGSQETYRGLDVIYEEYGVNAWRTYASVAYLTGRYHTEEELRIARDGMDDRNITDENYRDWYHAVRRVPLDIDEDTTIERSELEERLISFLVTMEKMTTAMLYIDIFRDLERREEEERRIEQARRVGREARARAVIDSEHSSESYPSALASDIGEDLSQERTHLVYERIVDPEEVEDPDWASEKYPSALASGSTTSSPLEVQSPDFISPGESSAKGREVSAGSSIDAPSKVSRSDPTSERTLLRSFVTTSSSKESGSPKTGPSSGEKPKRPMSKVASLEKSESFESTSRSISPLPLDTEMTEEEAKIPVDYKMGAQANFMGHVAVAGFLQSIEASILQEEETEMQVQPEPLEEEDKSADSKAKEKDEQSKRRERRSKDTSETDSKKPHMG